MQKVWEKIRIGYILNSADVKTQVSSQYSENSSHTHPHIPAHTHAYPFIPAYPCTPTHTLTHMPHISTHALNLINHMKILVNRVNGKMAKDR